MSDYDTPSACWTTHPKARKEHTCCECGSAIHKGEVYQNIAGVWSGQFDHYKTCSGCETLRDMLYSEGVESFYGGLFECMEEADLPIPAMEVLGVMAS